MLPDIRQRLLFLKVLSLLPLLLLKYEVEYGKLRNDTDRVKPKYSEKNVSSFFSTNLTWTDPTWNVGIRGEIPASNRLKTKRLPGSRS